MYVDYFLLPFLAVLTAIFLAMGLYEFFRTSNEVKKNNPIKKDNLLPYSDSETPNYNPFRYSNPVSCDQLIGREKELRFVVERIMNGGQSSAITGSSRSGKTSILACLAERDSEIKARLYGDRAEELIFSYFDISRMDSDSQTTKEVQFWERVLQPLEDHIAQDTQSSLWKAYENCRNKSFETYALEKLIAQIKQADWQLILLLDGFDGLLKHPNLNSPELFGSWRSLASLSKGALTLIITSNKSLQQQNQETEHFNITSSPYFNIFQEVVLGSLPDSAVDKLLHQGSQYFTDEDYHFIKEIAGGHPYLLQVVASMLWNAYEKDLTKPQQHVEQAVHNEVKETLSNIWQSWTSNIRKAFTMVALTHLETSPTQAKRTNQFIDNISNFELELEDLEKHGFVTKDENMPDGWRVYPNIFLSFVLDKAESELQNILDKKVNSA